ncbi:MAG: hypothetical protein AAF798_17080 [Bacteroidota bacterium]
MALFYASNKGLIDLDEFNEELTINGTTALDTAAPKPKSLLAPADTPNIPSFSPVGIGKPLSVEILTVYTGDAPRKFFGGRPDLLVVSGIKSVQTYDAAPRAINQIQENIRDYQYLKPGAFSNGSSIVYYTPSLDASTVFISFELVVDSLRRDTINSVANLFSTTAGLPIFVPAQSYLLAGSAIIELVGDLTDAFETGPYLQGNMDLRFLTSGIPVFSSGHYVVYNRDDRNEFSNHELQVVNDGFGNLTASLIHKQSQEEYKGDAPYLVLNVDGKDRPDLEGFTPKLASAAILEQFYGRNKGGQIVRTLERALDLFNDFSYRQRAERLQEKMNTYAPNSEEFLLAQALLEAYQKNIRNELFKLDLD